MKLLWLKEDSRNEREFRKPAKRARMKCFPAEEKKATRCCLHNAVGFTIVWH